MKLTGESASSVRKGELFLRVALDYDLLSAKYTQYAQSLTTAAIAISCCGHPRLTQQTVVRYLSLGPKIALKLGPETILAIRSLMVRRALTRDASELDPDFRLRVCFRC